MFDGGKASPGRGGMPMGDLKPPGGKFIPGRMPWGTMPWGKCIAPPGRNCMPCGGKAWPGAGGTACAGSPAPGLGITAGRPPPLLGCCGKGLGASPRPCGSPG